ncbi:MAG: Crp/Fnr family transcriptional regulator [Corynebacterium propinquum]|uniref:ROK family transcriptional regulator n=1 Tax=Corynebacterium propinquum TaxID=43769 RepID=UPI000DB60778|nr:ROK family transcriptional regulator [Corynebacterium propinquum]MCT1819060.1 ROK family transcriptional regulator [Corynebacterium propinquum]MDK4319632.1 ROK family transcriptional regulator [Corynebacterium propinquum]PZQ26535.1 MAG: Crp/Fnr family transcriptional regulator [Corynebacterium propinquum]
MDAPGQATGKATGKATGNAGNAGNAAESFPQPQAFGQPTTPAAKCLYVIRQNSVISRADLITATGLSQPTITRAITTLLAEGYVVAREDLARSHGRGRPTTPVELAKPQWMLAGIAVGTKETFLSVFDIRGRTIRESTIDTPVAQLSESDFIQHIMAGLHRLVTGLEHTLLSVGVTTSGQVSRDGVVSAPNLGWEQVDVAAALRYQFSVPVSVSSAVPAILGSEMQAGDLLVTDDADRTLVLFADDSLGAAFTNTLGVHPIEILPTVSDDTLGFAEATPEKSLITSSILARITEKFPELDPVPATLAQAVALAADNEGVREILDARASALARLTVDLVEEYRISTVVVAGSAFVDDSRAPKLFAATVREIMTTAKAPKMRMIPTHEEVVRSITRAAALDQMLREPLDLVPNDTA